MKASTATFRNYLLALGAAVLILASVSRAADEKEKSDIEKRIAASVRRPRRDYGYSRQSDT